MANLTPDQMNQVQIILKHLNRMDEELQEYREDMEDYDETFCTDLEVPLDIVDLEGNDLGFELTYPVCEYNLSTKSEDQG